MEVAAAAADPLRVEVVPVRRWPSMPLAAIKRDPHLAAWELVRLPRLSVLPVPRDCLLRLEALARPAPAG